MNYRKSLAALAFAFGSTMAGTALAGPDLLTNGGFETGDFSGWNASVDASYSGIDTVSAHSGNFGAYFGDFGAPGSISQSFATVAGAHYTIDLWLRSDGATPNSFEVLWGGNSVYSVSSIASSPYTEIVIDQQAAAALTTLELRARNDNGFLEVDDISVSAVPEPASFALLGAGLLLVVGRRAMTSSGRRNDADQAAVA
jgi:PEP-CTERM motif